MEIQPINTPKGKMQRDNLREQFLNDSLEETKNHLYSVGITIQTLTTLREENPICSDEITKTIQKLKKQKEFLEEIKQDDLKHINLIKNNVLKSRTFKGY